MMRASGRSPYRTLACAGFLVLPIVDQTPSTDPPLTKISGIRVGHHTLASCPTGCTVVLTEAGELAAVATAEAILRGVRAATGLPGYPSFGDLQGGAR